jgi:hypothetical protein
MLTPITTIHDRVRTWGEISGRHIDLQVGCSRGPFYGYLCGDSALLFGF